MPRAQRLQVHVRRREIAADGSEPARPPDICPLRAPDRCPRFASAEALNHALEACRDVPPWRRAEALSWWQSRAARIAQRRAARARRSGSTGDLPLTVDASRRSTLLA